MHHQFFMARRVMDRLIMVLETDDAFSFEAKAAADAAHAPTCQWEALMWRYQRALPCAAPGSKWVLCDKVYELSGGSSSSGAGGT